MWGIVLCVLLLTGCAAKEFETVSDEYVAQPPGERQQVMLQMPAEAAAPAMQSEKNGTLYLCDGYAITVQILEAGDLEATFRETTGYSKEALTVLEYQQGDETRYDCVWTCAGEGGDQVGKAAVLSDGNYHYVVSVLADAKQAGQLQEAWNELFASFRLVSADTVINTGS